MDNPHDHHPEKDTAAPPPTQTQAELEAVLDADADLTALRPDMTKLAMIYHPDRGGRPDQMTRVNAAYERALQERPR